MKPRKVVLLVDSNERARMVRAFVLETAGWRVFEAETVDAALLRLAGFPASGLPGALVALVATVENGMATDRLLTGARRLQPEAAVVLLGDGEFAVGLREGSLAFDCWLDQRLNTAVLQDTLKRVTARKRGPRKAHVRRTSNLMPLGGSLEELVPEACAAEAGMAEAAREECA